MCATCTRRQLHEPKWAWRYFVLTDDGRLEWCFSAHEGKKLTQRRKDEGKLGLEKQRQQVLLRFFAVQRLQSRSAYSSALDFRLDLHPAPDSADAADPFQHENRYEERDMQRMLESCMRFELRCGDECLQLASNAAVAEDWMEKLRFQVPFRGDGPRCPLRARMRDDDSCVCMTADLAQLPQAAAVGGPAEN